MRFLSFPFVSLVLVLLPDEVIPEAFAAQIAPALRPGAALVLASGYTLAYGLIAPPDGVDVVLMAPRMAGETARARFEAGQGFWAYVHVERDASGRAHGRMLGVAAGLGCLRAGALDVDARMEATIDLYIEQTVGPLLGAALLTAFEVGAAADIPPEVLVLEMYMSGELETVFRAFREEGFFRASESHGPTALYGGMLRTLELDRAPLFERFRAVLDDIRSGGFADRFQAERAAGYPTLGMARAMIHADSAMSRAEDAVRRGVRETAERENE